MRALKIQFFLLFGSFAAVQPFVALLFKERGLSAAQIGYAIGVSGWAIMLSPALITLVADTKMNPRRLLGCLGLATAAALGGLLWARGYVSQTLFYFLYSLTVTAMIPLQDGITFGYQRQQREEGLPELDYNKIRVWGTLGYVGFLIALFYPIRETGNVSLAIWLGVLCFCILFLNTYWMPDRGRRETAKRAQRLPTSQAVMALLGKRTIHFTIAMFLLLMASAGYHTMYPIFLTETLGLAKHWLGIVIMLGALLEVFFILGLARWESRWGLRVVMLAGVGLSLLRFVLMYGFPNLSVAIATQLLHGPMICAMMVIPPSYLNSLANESNRNSIQGVYTMLVVGSSRFVGTVISGHVAAVGQREVYLLCVGLTALALAFVWIGFGRAREVE